MNPAASPEPGDLERDRSGSPFAPLPNQLFRDVIAATVSVDESRRLELASLMEVLGYEVEVCDGATICRGPDFGLEIVDPADGLYALRQVRLALSRAESGRRVYELGRSVLRFTSGPEAVWEFQ